MRLDIHSRNRLGITYEVLAVFARHKTDVRAIDMITHHIYVDAPAITDRLLPRLESELVAIPGISKVKKTDMLPSERRRVQLHAVLTAMPQPVIAADLKGKILFANRAAALVLGITNEEHLKGRKLKEVLDRDAINEIVRNGYAKYDREIQIKDEAYFVHTAQFGLDRTAKPKPLGGIIILQSRTHLGGIMSALDKKGVGGFGSIIGNSKIMKSVKERAARLAPIDAPLLIHGETGTGKELFARACHTSSPRAESPFLAINCAALSESLAESELFGYADGAFSNASRGGKPGLFELADKGTLFLDEIGEMTPYLQAKLLRFLQDGTFRRIGGSKEIKVNVRIISATNRDLSKMTDEGNFRADLLFRLNVLSINTPPLREHLEDIPDLVKAFANNSVARLGRRPVRLSKTALIMLTQCEWPGNVRELENVIFRSISLHETSILNSANLIFDNDSALQKQTHSIINQPKDYQMALELFERNFFTDAKQHFESTRQLAKRIGVSHTTVARKLKKYGLV